jgi:hypothetical protein
MNLVLELVLAGRTSAHLIGSQRAERSRSRLSRNPGEAWQSRSLPPPVRKCPSADAATTMPG